MSSSTERVHHQGRGKSAQDVSQDDLVRAIKKLKAMENCFGMIPVGSSYLVQSVPAELNMDHTVVLQLAEKKGYISVSEIRVSQVGARACLSCAGTPVERGLGMVGYPSFWRATVLAASPLLGVDFP